MISALRIALIVAVVLVLLVIYLMQPITGVTRRQITLRADASRLRAHVEVLASDMVPRSARRPENLVRATEYIRDQFAAAGAAVSFQPVGDGGPAFRNVVARMGSESGPRIVVGAHFDAADAAVGADGNASGVAGLLELARLAQAEPVAPTLTLVAFSSEEPPWFRTSSMGSFVHAEGLKRAGIAVEAMICLEMIGYFSDAPDSQRYPIPGLQLLYPSKGNFIAVVGCIGQESLVRKVKRGMLEAATIPVYSMNAPRALPGIDFSDHLNYWNAGFAAVMVTDTAFYRNPNYHEATDTPDTLDYARMALVVDGVFGALRTFLRRT